MIHWLFRRRRGLEEKRRPDYLDSTLPFFGGGNRNPPGPTKTVEEVVSSSSLTAGSPDKRSQKVKKEKHLKPKYHNMMFLLNWCEN